MDSVDTVLDELSHLQNVLEQAKSWHSTKREMTFFDTALRKHYENPTTELLSFFLNSENEHGLHGVFYQGLLAALAADGTADWNADAWGDVQCVQTEVVTDKGRIDLLIETDRAVLAIECKIGHHQNNPFVDYQQYVQKNYAKEDTVLLILCVDGKSHIKDWTGVSYRTLARHTKPLLAEALLDQPYNKWALFAREFLIHWEKLGMDEMNQQQVDFVVSNFEDIKRLSQMRDGFYSHAKKHIIETLESELEGDKFQYRLTNNWSGGPVLRFAHNDWKNLWSDVSVHLHDDQQPLQCSVWLCIEKPTSELIEKTREELSLVEKPVFDTDNWNENGKRYWGCCWKMPFDLNNVSNEVIALMQVLIKVEAARNA